MDDFSEYKLNDVFIEWYQIEPTIDLLSSDSTVNSNDNQQHRSSDDDFHPSSEPCQTSSHK